MSTRDGGSSGRYLLRRWVAWVLVGAALVVPGAALAAPKFVVIPLDDIPIVIPIDSDGDGLKDADERRIYGTDPHKADTDGDGMPDGWEVANGLNPLANDAGGDPDGDGVSNLVEYKLGTDPLLATSVPTVVVNYGYDSRGGLVSATVWTEGAGP